MEAIVNEINKIGRFNDALLELAEYLGNENPSTTDIMFIMSDLTDKHITLVNKLKHDYNVTFEDINCQKSNH